MFSVSEIDFPICQHLQLASPVTEAQRLLKANGKNYFYKLRETNAFDYLDSPVVRGNRFGDSVYKTFGNLWKNKKNGDTVRLLLDSLNTFSLEK